MVKHMMTWIVTWVAMEPGSGQRMAHASMFRAETMGEAAKTCEERYGKREGYKLVVVSLFP